MVITIILYGVGLLLLVFGLLIWNGKTGLIHDYHRKNVTDHKSYGKDMGKPVFIIGVALCLTATLPLIREEWLAFGTAIFFVALATMLVRMYFVQKKHNGSMFS